MENEEHIPLNYMLDYVRNLGQTSEARVIERMLMLYYLEQGKGDIAYRLSGKINETIRPVRHNSVRAVDDAQLKEVIQDILSSGLISVLTQFIGIYRILVDYFDFPKAYTDFCHRIERLGLLYNGKPIEYKSLYQAIQKGIVEPNVLSKPYSEWQQYGQSADGDAYKFTRAKQVADKFVEVLKRRNLL